MKVALVHDYLKEFGGAERVLLALHEIWPRAPVYVAFCDWKKMGQAAEKFRHWDIRPSWVQRCWLVKKFYSPLRFVLPLIWGSFDFREFDIVISSSSWYMPKAIKVKPPTKHLCYLHAVPRYLYGFKTAVEWQRYWPVRIYATIVNHFLRLYDFKTSQRVDYFIANSKTTAERIKKFYRREATVIYPPVDLPKAAADSLTLRVKKPKPEGFSSAAAREGKYFLAGGRMAAAKHFDLAILACNKLNLPLKIYGSGRLEKELRRLAGPTVEFLGYVSDEKLAELYAGCQAYIFPTEDEELGMVALEAMSYGKPVIGLRSGGLRETIIEGKTGVFFEEPTVESLVKGIKGIKGINFKPEDCRRQARKFGKERFKREILEFLDSHGFKTDFHR